MSDELRINMGPMEQRAALLGHAPAVEEPREPAVPAHSALITRHSGLNSNLGTRTTGLHLSAGDFRFLFERLGPSLGLWRAAEVAALRQITYEHPVLDLGCGDGLVTSLVLDLVDLGLDPEREALDAARRSGIYERLEPVRVEDAGLPRASFSTVLSNSVLEHVTNIDAVLAEIARILRPGGRLIFTSPTECFTPWLVLPVHRYRTWRNHRLAHLNLWPVEEWTRRLNRAGLEVELVQPYLRRSLVTLWDGLELLQQIWIGRQRLFSLGWRRIPPSGIDALARRAATINLSAPTAGGGRLIVAVKPF